MPPRSSTEAGFSLLCFRFWSPLSRARLPSQVLPPVFSAGVAPGFSSTFSNFSSIVILCRFLEFLDILFKKFLLLFLAYLLLYEILDLFERYVRGRFHTLQPDDVITELRLDNGAYLAHFFKFSVPGFHTRERGNLWGGSLSLPPEAFRVGVNGIPFGKLDKVFSLLEPGKDLFLPLPRFLPGYVLVLISPLFLEFLFVGVIVLLEILIGYLALDGEFLLEGAIP